MRSLFLLPVAAQAATIAYFKDAACSEPMLERKINANCKSKRSTHVVPFDIGVCRTLEPVYEVDLGDCGGKTKYSFTKGVSCSEYGGWSAMAFGKEHADCIVDVEKLSEEDGRTKSFGSSVSSVCVSRSENNMHIDDTDEEFVKVDCNPNDGSVAAIVLSSIGLVLSLAAIGLAAVAGSKKGGGAPAAKPAEPAVPAATPEGQAQGSTTAAAAVGAATDA